MNIKANPDTNIGYDVVLDHNYAMKTRVFKFELENPIELVPDTGSKEKVNQANENRLVENNEIDRESQIISDQKLVSETGKIQNCRTDICFSPLKEETLSRSDSKIDDNLVSETKFSEKNESTEFNKSSTLCEEVLHDKNSSHTLCEEVFVDKNVNENDVHSLNLHGFYDEKDNWEKVLEFHETQILKMIDANKKYGKNTKVNTPSELLSCCLPEFGTFQDGQNGTILYDLIEKESFINHPRKTNSSLNFTLFNDQNGIIAQPASTLNFESTSILKSSSASLSSSWDTLNCFEENRCFQKNTSTASYENLKSKDPRLRTLNDHSLLVSPYKEEKESPKKKVSKMLIIQINLKV